MSETTYCKYHQHIPSRWYCEQCGIDFCNSCVNDQLYSDPPQCALCHEVLSDMGDESNIPPFWHKIHLFFRIPLTLPSILVIIVLLCLGYIFSLIPIVGWLMLLIVIPAIFFKYAYLMLQNIASGELKAPALNILFENNDYDIIFKQIFILIFLFSPMSKIIEFNFILGLAWYFLILFLIPATVMVLSIGQNFFQAINPLALITLIMQIGFSYLGLYLLITIISGGPTIIMEMVIGLSDMQLSDLSEHPYLFVFYAVLQMYFTLVIFSIMGYVLLKYHHRLGYTISAPIVELFGEQKSIAKIHPLLKDIEVLAKENKIEEALHRLQSRLPENKNDIVLRLRFHKILLNYRKFESMLLHAPSLIQLLLNSNDKAQAVDVYRDCINVDKEFSPADVNLFFPLAEIMFQVGQYRLIVTLLNGFHKLFPDYQQTPDVYFILARALSDGLDNDTTSLSVLDFILKKYPDTVIKPQLITYRDTVQKLASLAIK
ncbi:MAG: hypothetical protein KZQ83_08525 [gamma proteobacterium symbiont of Taylorina sp.]|nr:hypothetical protein [gamma proteobacterium symbiont of Taylorina sp.]